MKKFLALLLGTMLLLSAFTALAENDAATYINPLSLDYPLAVASDKGIIPENPFETGEMIANQFIPNDPIESVTHMRFQTLFRGTGTYLLENDYRDTSEPSVLYYNGLWYMFSSNSALYRGKDFSNWEFVTVKSVDGENLRFGGAPTIAMRIDEEGKEHFYLAWNRSNLWEAEAPEGPYTDLGSFTYNGKSFAENMEDGILITANNDVNIFVDDDGRMYLYWGMGPYICGAELDVDNPTKLITEPKVIIEYDNRYKWQNFGQHHQDYENGYPEGAWMVKIDDTYYLTWSTSGVQYDSYTMGCYQSTTGPLDGFELQEREIINQSDALTGVVRGGGHGCIVEGPSDTLWCFYTVNVGYEGDMESFIGADPAMIDDEGNLVVPHLSESPQYVAGVLDTPAEGNEVGYDVISARSSYAISSYSEGRHPIYAIDESCLTWWQPAADDDTPWYVVAFKGNYNVEAFRIMLKEINIDKASTIDKSCINYKIELYNGETNPLADSSSDNWVTVYEKTNSSTNIIDYVKLEEPCLSQFARITFTDWPEDIYPGLVEFTVFGNSTAKPVE